MDQIHIRLISQLLGIQETQVNNTVSLLNEGATIPFISRYRKERTGSLDEVQVEAIKDEKEKLEELLKRRETILKTILEQNLLTPELKKRIEDCFDPTELDSGSVADSRYIRRTRTDEREPNNCANVLQRG